VVSPTVGEEPEMHANVGDHIVIHSTHVDEHVREGEILEVHGAGGEPPFLVRWSDTGHEALFFPGPDAEVRHAAAHTD
jgi:hypothetical protein